MYGLASISNRIGDVEIILKYLKFCHVTGGKYNLDCHLYLSDITIENYRNIGCKVKILLFDYE